MSRGNFDKYISVFSPEGHLYQVQYAFKAVSYPGITTVAVRAKDCCVVATQHQVPDKLMRSDSVTALFKINNSIGCCVTGRAPDGRSVIEEARSVASDYQYKFGVEIPVSVLAKRVADRAQVFTQRSGYRPMGVTLTFIGMDVADNGAVTPQLYKVDPAGSYAGYFGTATGAKEVETVAFLEKRQRQTPFDTMSTDEAIVLVLSALQTITGSSMKADEVEVGICSATTPTFERVSNAAIEAHLTSIAEAD